MRSFWRTTVAVYALALGFAVSTAHAAEGLKVAADEVASAIQSISRAADETRPDRTLSYPDPRAMLENADMAAFMEESRGLYRDGNRSESWGFAVVDMICAGQFELMLKAHGDMPKSDAPGRALTQQWLKPWVLANSGEPYQAVKAMRSLEGDLPALLYRGHTALLLEGIGWYDDAIDAYDFKEGELSLPDPDAEPTEESVLQSLAFGKLRIMAFRKADLLRKLERNDEAQEIYEQLIAADEDDYYALRQMDELATGKAPESDTLDLQMAMALALNDEANILEERQALASVLFAQGAEAPFNHFVSSLRQTAMVLDPANAGIREIEADHLYDHGFFEASARIALSGEASPDERADLMMSAAKSYLELGRLERAAAMVEQALEFNPQDGLMLLSAADLLIEADQGERAAQFAAQALNAELQQGLVSYAYITKSEAHFQAGDIASAIESARKAYAADQEDDQIREFLATQLLQDSETRSEGIEIYRDLYIDSLNDPGMMNNFGYSLINNPQSPEQLDEGFKILKRANRITPFEANLLDSLGWAYYQYGDFERALEYIDQAVAQFEPFTHWELLDHRGDVLYRLGREEEAKASWEKALDSRPPRHHQTMINSKLNYGMTTPAPEKRTPPLVPRSEPVETNEI